MDDRELEARLSARLHQRFDRAEPPLALSRDISDARLYARSSGRRSGLISLLAAAAVFAVAVVALGAWFSRPADIGGVPTASPGATASPSPAATVAPTASPSPTPEPTVAPTVGAVRPCKGSDLAAQVTRWEGAAGSRFGTLAVQNIGPTACTISGTPAVQLVDGQATVFLDSADLGKPATATPPDLFTLAGARGGTIYLVVGLSNYCGAAPSSPVTVALVLPGDLGRVVATLGAGVTIDMAPCNGPGAPTTLGVQEPWSTTAP